MPAGTQRGYITGTVCPVVPTRVGTGILMAGGNYDSSNHNHTTHNHQHPRRRHPG